jgi:MinD-like ATPase involved in chromosome partitioning or flagellar assembly
MVLAGTGRSPADLVAGLARLHGVLDIDPGADGALLHVLAGIRTDAADVRAAHARVAERVGRMWAA